MPSKSKKQHDMMEGASHDKKYAKEMGVPQKVAKEYTDADKKSGKYKSKKNKSK